ncbi:DUF4190 domain-containing protein [Cohnella ginsengisoli]|uniref:DUF4190 domain-containing protein n=1 Tax=Cohnella ginsengisoli TaxID=425004 RepID=A0A9X4QQN0_9BACL|nr:DUF4190 domain-containing protein [Cohnella ginsengisoli]MDG0794766.1 DUF4190 domain-containing protein [Cohnella ginsengisoli]
MTSDDSNNNWGGPGPTDPSPGPDAGTAPDASPSQPADRGGEAAGDRAPLAPSEPARAHDAQADSGYRAANEHARTHEAQAERGSPAADDRTRTHEGHAAAGGYRAPDEPARSAQGWRPEPQQGGYPPRADEPARPHDRHADGDGYRAADEQARAPQGWQPEPQQGGYPPRADHQHAPHAVQPHAPNQGGYYPPPPHGSSYGQHPNHGQHPYGGGSAHPSSFRPPAYDYARPPLTPPARSNSKSVAALILGIGSIVIPFIGFFLGVVGIIVSAISLKEIRVRGEQGSGMAVAGLICSIVGTVLYFVIIALIIIFAIAGATDNNYDYNNYSNIIMEA